MSDPVFLYNDPHPVHEKMANWIGAEFVECSKGGLLNRLRAGASRNFENRPVLIEGGVPLLEAGFIGWFRNSGPIIELAADATIIDIETPLEGRPYHERIAHAFGERQVDATIAVSDYIAAYARMYDRPVHVVHPFVEREKYNRLVDLSPGGDGETVLCIGKYRHKNGQDILREAIEWVNEPYMAHFIGSGTEVIQDSDRVRGHGFVDIETFYNLLDSAEIMVYPARAGAYPVAILEAMLSGTPVLTSPYVGNADLVRSLHPNFVTEPNPRNVATHIEWAVSRDLGNYGNRTREIAKGFEEEPLLESFEKQFSNVVSKLVNK